MKKSFKIISTLFVFLLLMVFVLPIGVFAGSESDNCGNDFSFERNYGEQFLKSLGKPRQLINSVPLLNLDGELEAVCLSMDNTGYIIINTKDLSIPELSFESSSPFNNRSETYVYNGPLSHMRKSGTNLINLDTNEIVNQTLTGFKYKKDSLGSAKKLAIVNELTQKVRSTEEAKLQASVTEKYLSKPLKKWSISTTEWCGPTAAAILMQFYDDVVSESFVESSNENSDLIYVMIDCVEDAGGTFNNGACSPNELKDGINEYLSDRGISGYNASTLDYKWSTITSCINKDRPVIVIRIEGKEGHAMTAHGYVISTSFEYIVVNDGWKHNDVWIEDDNIPGTIKLAK